MNHLENAGLLIDGLLQKRRDVVVAMLRKPAFETPQLQYLVAVNDALAAAILIKGDEERMALVDARQGAPGTQVPDGYGNMVSPA